MNEHALHEWLGMHGPNLYYDEIFKIMPRYEKFINLMLNITIPVGKMGYIEHCNDF
jgi:hypothetical protein